MRRKIVGSEVGERWAGGRGVGRRAMSPSNVGQGTELGFYSHYRGKLVKVSA